jgi:hypothetical protein
MGRSGLSTRGAAACARLTPRSELKAPLSWTGLRSGEEGYGAKVA